jgi:hypothetical protein
MWESVIGGWAFEFLRLTLSMVEGWELTESDPVGLNASA